jgi:hypothetical protein
LAWKRKPAQSVSRYGCQREAQPQPSAALVASPPAAERHHAITSQHPDTGSAPLSAPSGCLIEAPWLISGGHGASFRQLLITDGTGCAKASRRTASRIVALAHDANHDVSLVATHVRPCAGQP